jgi:hypothetical protein
MSSKHAQAFFAVLLGATVPAMALAAAGPALAAPPAAPAPPRASAGPNAGAPRPHHARASLRLDVGQAKPWVGQALPVTVTAFFRDVEGVTLEGAVQLESKAIITTELARAPRQSTSIIDGQPTLVVTWTGTVTPSAPGPLDLNAKLPVRIRYRDAATPQVTVHESDDLEPFGDLDADPFGASMFSRLQKRMQQQMQQMQQSAEQTQGRLHEEATSLEASAPPLEALALPVADQPASFSGAVGDVELHATISSTHAHVSDPVTLRIEATGAGDLDRVELPGIASDGAWKAYPARVVSEPAPDAAGKTRGAGAPRGRSTKVFEQVLVPLHGGDLTVPPLVLTTFDPKTGTYVNHATAPLTVTVEGAAYAASVAPPPQRDDVTAPEAAAPSSPALPTLPSRDEGGLLTTARAALATFTLARIGAGVAAVTLFAIVVLLFRRFWPKRDELVLRRRMRRASTSGSAATFFSAAHDFIAACLARRWGVRPQDVTAASVRSHLGEKGIPLVEALAADEAMRFGGAGMPDAPLGPLCSSIERALHAAV